MNQSVVSEVSSNLLFRYRIPCAKIKDDKKTAVELPAANAIPDFSESDSGKSFSQLRTAWSETGIYFWLKVQRKKQSLWCRKTQLLESDGLQIWLDTRDTHNVHRATKYCHWFLFLPEGDGGDQKKPISTMLKINRAREHSPAINQYPISVSSSVSKTGYTMAIFIPGTNINGWETNEHRMIGFNYIVTDRELGIDSLGLGVEFPISEDPSLWQTLILQG